MNIFKVFASAKKGFQEEYASAILAWLLNPHMEHGLGYAFLTEFLLEISKSAKNNDLKDIESIANRLGTHLRNNSLGVVGCETYLELYAGQRYIDVVVNLEVDGDRWTVAIENKIFGQSASDSTQLMMEYGGLKDPESEPLAASDDKLAKAFKDRKILMIFLVPIESSCLSDKIVAEWDGLKVETHDRKALVTWGENANLYPSVANVISALLDKETKGNIEPIHESVRQTLKALKSFISNGFGGYPYITEKVKDQNDKTEKRLSYSELLNRQEGWVGVQHGIGGLLRIIADTSQTGGLFAPNLTFQYTTANMKNSNVWLDIKTFKDIAALTETKPTYDLSWMNEGELKLRADLISYIATRTNQTNQMFYVGVKGGAKAVPKMNSATITKKSWLVGNIKKNNLWFEAQKLVDEFAKLTKP